MLFGFCVLFLWKLLCFFLYLCFDVLSCSNFSVWYPTSCFMLLGWTPVGFWLATSCFWLHLDSVYNELTLWLRSSKHWSLSVGKLADESKQQEHWGNISFSVAVSLNSECCDQTRHEAMKITAKICLFILQNCILGCTFCFVVQICWH